MAYLYRGVHARHPERAAAAAGVVIPAKPDANITPKHNVGGFSYVSQYTSWTRDIDVARRFADSEGPGGVLLRLAESAPRETDLWSWEYSDDGWREEEVLLRGIRIGAEVLK